MDMQDAIYNVDATALFYSRPKPDMGDLLLELNDKLAETGLHLTVSPLTHNDWWLLACEKFHIMVAFRNGPAKEGVLDSAVRSPITSLSRFDYGQAVESHRASINIEVGDGHAPLPPEARLIMQEFGSSQTCDPVLKMKALHWTAQFIGGHESFLALHFGPSDRLFCPDELKAAAGHDFPEPLLTHPVPSLPEEGPNGVDGYALALRNPQFLGGTQIELEGVPVKVPLAASVSLLRTLRTAHNAGKLPLEHGKILTPSEKLRLYVREADAKDGATQPRFILSFWNDRGHDAPKPMAAAVADAEPAKAQGVRSFLKRRAEDAVRAPEEAVTTPVAASTPTVSVEAETAPQRHEESRQRFSLGQWMMRRAHAITLESRVKAAGISLIFGMPFLWNPYDDFTGGLSLEGTQVARAGITNSASSDRATLADTFIVTMAMFSVGR